MSARRWWWALGTLAAVRCAFPLAALAASGQKLPALPRYAYGPLNGDAPGYLSTARELLSADRSLGAALAPLFAGVLAVGWWALRERRRRPAVAVAAFSLAVFVALAIGISRSTTTPAGAVGWPLLWSLPLLPFRVFSTAIDSQVSFAAGLVLSLAANAAAVVATAYAGRYASRSSRVGLLAAALFALWPVLPAAIVGSNAWENGTWNVDAGLALYTEPVSTACVTIGLALLLTPRRTPTRLVLAGIALGYAVAIRPTNIVFLMVALAVLAVAALRDALPFVAGALTVGPIVIAFLPKKTGYDISTTRSATGTVLWSSDYVLRSFTHSHMWQPALLAVLLPFALAGLVALRSRSTAVLVGAGVLANAIVYAFFVGTAEHPRYLFAGLPLLLVLWAAGFALAARRLVLRRG